MTRGLDAGPRCQSAIEKKVLQALGCGRLVRKRFLINAKSLVDSRARENVADRISGCLAEEVVALEVVAHKKDDEWSCDH